MLQDFCPSSLEDEFSVYNGNVPVDILRFWGAELVSTHQSYAEVISARLTCVATQACGIHHIHKQGIIHRDLKIENVLLDQKGHIVIADFGLSCRPVKSDPHGDATAEGLLGTCYYMAPEVWTGEPYTISVDWFAFGVLLHLLHTMSVSAIRCDSLADIG